MFQHLWRYIVVAFALLLIFAGLIVFPLPIPLGLIMMVAGLAVLLGASKTARIWFREFRGRYPSIDQRISRVEPLLPEALRRVLKRDN